MNNSTKIEPKQIGTQVLGEVNVNLFSQADPENELDTNMNVMGVLTYMYSLYPDMEEF